MYLIRFIIDLMCLLIIVVGIQKLVMIGLIPKISGWLNTF